MAVPQQVIVTREARVANDARAPEPLLPLNPFARPRVQFSPREPRWVPAILWSPKKLRPAVVERVPRPRLPSPPALTLEAERTRLDEGAATRGEQVNGEDGAAAAPGPAP